MLVISFAAIFMSAAFVRCMPCRSFAWTGGPVNILGHQEALLNSFWVARKLGIVAFHELLLWKKPTKLYLTYS